MGNMVYYKYVTLWLVCFAINNQVIGFTIVDGVLRGVKK